MKRIALSTCVLLLATTLAATEPRLRETISLDGTWQIAEGGLDEVPAKFEHEVPVPGLVSLATPPFDAPGPTVANRSKLPSKDPQRDAFWYRRTFTIPGPIPAVATLKVSKAMFGTRVILNGTVLGDHAPCFTPGYFDARAALKTGENEVVIRVGADREAVTTAIPSGFDYEKEHYVPGIFDSVELILSGTPNIVNAQVAPDVPNRQARVRVWLKNATDGDVTAEIREVKSSKAAGTASARMAAGPEQVLDLAVPISDCQLWSPENPFLYELTVRTSGDAFVTRFGMRGFKFDPATGKAQLNGKPYAMRGSNITLYRFFEDPECGDLPWREDWVRLLHQRVKDMHWNCLRYCIGFPPEAWYRIADEEGILIQDEFPIWFGGKNWSTWPKELKSDELAKEYEEWMRERWNHPSVAIWDANNETFSEETGPAIRQVRDLDLSRRPWDNSYMPPAEPGDVLEQHPYHFQNADFKLSSLATAPPAPWQNAEGHGAIINEYGWLWLNRDGTPTTLTEKLYRNLLGENSTTEQRRQLYARYTAAETEFWRSRRTAAAVMHFTALGYSRPGGQTSDHWIDVENLTWEPEFYRYVRDAFAPVGLAIDAWAEDYLPGKEQAFPIIVVNDLDDTWKGDVQFRILRKGKPVAEQHLPAEIAEHGSSRLVFSVSIPKRAGDYQAEAVLPTTPTGAVRSLRDFAVFTRKQREARETVSQQSRLKCDPQDHYGHREDGTAGRVVKLSLSKAELKGSATVTLECGGRAETTPFNNLQGVNELTVLMPEGAGVAQDCPATFTLRSGSLTLTESVTVPAKRQWTVYIYPHAHVDIGYTAPQDIIEKVHVRNVEVGIDLGQKTADYPAGARHVWNPEAQWVVDTYLRDASAEKKSVFLDAVKQGHVALDANYDNANTSACSDEEFLRFFRNGIELRKMTGQPVDTLVQFDIPGMSWGVVQAAAQCGVRGVFSFPNHLDRIGTVREAWEHKPFWWVAPDGKTRVLFVQGWPYGMGYVLKGSKVPSPPYRSPGDQYPEEEIGRIPSPVQEYRKDVDRLRTDNPSANFLDPFLFDDTRRLEQAGSPYDIYAMTWSMADNSFVDADLPEAVKAWNEKYAYPKLVIASAHDILTAYETKFGGIIPEVRGDYTEYWTDGLGSDALRVGYNRLAKERLVQAEMLWTMLQRTVPAPTAAINDAWRWVFLGSEHTWGYYNPASPHAKRVEQVKAS